MVLSTNQKIALIQTFQEFTGTMTTVNAMRQKLTSSVTGTVNEYLPTQRQASATHMVATKCVEALQTNIADEHAALAHFSKRLFTEVSNPLQCVTTMRKHQSLGDLVILRQQWYALFFEHILP